MGSNPIEYMRAWRAAHPGAMARYARTWKKKHPEKVRAENRRRVTFKDKRVATREIPRVGVCTACGQEGQTVRHHDEYIEANPLACTRELCRPCHMTYHEEQKRKWRKQ